MPTGFGVDTIENEIAKIDEDGVSETIVLPRQSVPVEPAATGFGYVVGTAGDFLGAVRALVSSSGACTSTEPSPRAAASGIPRAS